MWLKPYAIIKEGSVKPGHEVYFEDGIIKEIRPYTSSPDPYILSPAFVNAHSHLEYRGLQDAISEASYWPWIRELTSRKFLQDVQQVRLDTILAAMENRQTGVALIGEWSDRPYAGEAMTKAGLKGILYQEVLTVPFANGESAEEMLGLIHQKKRNRNEQHYNETIFWAPHAPYTVHSEMLAFLARQGQPLSIHVAETELEDQFFLGKGGPIADFCTKYQFPLKPTGTRTFEYLEQLGLVKKGVQFVHCCALLTQDVECMAKAGVTVAHCARSNKRLGCPIAPVREMLDAGILVGLGLDSPASGGSPDMFAEMRAVLELSETRKALLYPEEIWKMATIMGAKTLGQQDWDIKEGAHLPLIQIWQSEIRSTKELIYKGSPEKVSWV